MSGQVFNQITRMAHATGLWDWSMKYADGTEPSRFRPEDVDPDKMKWYALQTLRMTWLLLIHHPMGDQRCPALIAAAQATPRLHFPPNAYFAPIPSVGLTML